MTWQRRKRAIAEARVFDGRSVLHVIGWEIFRHCGCRCWIGMRMDKNEVTFGAQPCDQHPAQNQRAMDAMQHMPPQERDVGELWRELLDREIEIVP